MNFGKISKKVFNTKPYKVLSIIMVLTWILLASINFFRDNLYGIDNQYITLFAETSPNLIASFLFTLISMLYVLPYFKGINSINKPIFIWLINVLNIIVFSLIEYIHVILNLGTWDNNDIVASMIGLALSTAIYFQLRKGFHVIFDKY